MIKSTQNTRYFCHLLCILASTALIRAQDLALNPDENTAWRQSNEEFTVGDSAPLSPDFWVITPNLTITPGPDGLAITARPPEPGESDFLTRVVPFDEHYPWLQFEIKDPGPNVNHGRRGFYVFPTNMAKDSGRGLGINMEPGRYVTRLRPSEDNPGQQSFIFRIHISGIDLTLKDLCMVADPLPRIEMNPVDPGIEIPTIGDEMKVTVFLAEAAEDVTVGFYGSSFYDPVDIGVGGNIQLKPEDGDGKIWSAKFSLGEKKGGKTRTDETGQIIVPGGLILKALILGGNFSQPLFNWNETGLNILR